MFRHRIKRVVILGCGPAGIFAAHACFVAGMPFTIYSRKAISPLYGAQYLQAPIPGLSLKPSQEVSYTLLGTAAEYGMKVYGKTDVIHRVSHPLDTAWDIREAYANGWSLYHPAVQHVSNIDKWAFTSLHSPEQRPIYEAMKDPGAQIISTIPANLLCSREDHHVFNVRAIYAAGEAPDLGMWLHDFDIPPNSVINNGLDAPRWTRAYNVFGHKTIEWPGDRKPPISNVAKVNKVISTNCDCLLPMVWRTGRMGTWDKMVFAHNAYEYTAAALKIGRTS